MMNATNTDQLAQDFVKFALASGVLGFGEFKTKAGRMSPYFFNAGLFDDIDLKNNYSLLKEFAT